MLGTWSQLERKDYPLCLCCEVLRFIIGNGRKEGCAGMSATQRRRERWASDPSMWCCRLRQTCAMLYQQRSWPHSLPCGLR